MRTYNSTLLNIESINNQFRALSDLETIKALKNDNVCTFSSKVSETKN